MVRFKKGLLSICSECWIDEFLFSEAAVSGESGCRLGAIDGRVWACLKHGSTLLRRLFECTRLVPLAIDPTHLHASLTGSLLTGFLNEACRLRCLIGSS